MKKLLCLSSVALICLWVSGDASGRGFGGGGSRGGGGGGFNRGGGGFDRGGGDRGGGDRGGAAGWDRGGGGWDSGGGGEFRGAGGWDRAGGWGGGVASRGDLQHFLDLPGGSGAAIGAMGAAGGLAAERGGAAAAFLQEHPAAGAEMRNPGAGQFSGAGNRPNGGQIGQGNRTPGERLPGNRTPGERLPGNHAGQIGKNRPNKINDRQGRQDQRQDRRNEIAKQLKNHDHDFHNWYNHDWWHNHPYDRWAFNQPWGWFWAGAAWGNVMNWFPWGWSQPVYYNYGDNVYYSGDQVYYGNTSVATAQQYADQAQQLAESVPANANPANGDWMSLGVFALTQDGESSGAEPTMFVQLAVSKQGILAGTYQNTATDVTQGIQGMVDKKNQRAAWGVTGQKWPILETGIYNLTTQTTAPVLVHFADGQTQQWLMVRVDEPKGGNTQPTSAALGPRRATDRTAWAAGAAAAR